MKLVRIIRGTFGHNTGRMVEPKTSSDAPFMVDDAVAARIVAKGIAEYAETTPTPPSTPPPADPPAELKQKQPEGGQQAGGEKAAEPAQQPAAADPSGPAYSLEMTRAELNAIALCYGIPNPDKMSSKQKVVDAIDSAKAKGAEYVAPGEEEPPQLGAADPVDG